MANETKAAAAETSENEAMLRIYEIGYHIPPTLKEEDVEKVVANVRSLIEKQGGSFIAEGAPSMIRLSYDIAGSENGKRADYDRAYFGWIKFEAPVAAAAALDEALRMHASILRSILFQTVREETRARLKLPQLREVKRSDVIKAAPRAPEAPAAPVSEADLEKALEDITAE